MRFLSFYCVKLFVTHNSHYYMEKLVAAPDQPFVFFFTKVHFWTTFTSWLTEWIPFDENECFLLRKGLGSYKRKFLRGHAFMFLQNSSLLTAAFLDLSKAGQSSELYAVINNHVYNSADFQVILVLARGLQFFCKFFQAHDYLLDVCHAWLKSEARI